MKRKRTRKRQIILTRPRRRGKRKGKTKSPAGFEPTTFQCSDWQAGQRTVVLQPQPQFLSLLHFYGLATFYDVSIYLVDWSFIATETIKIELYRRNFLRTIVQVRFFGVNV